MALALSAFSMVDAHARHHAEPVEAMARVHMATTHHGKNCTLTKECSGRLPKHAHHLCGRKTHKCEFACNKGFRLNKRKDACILKAKAPAKPTTTHIPTKMPTTTKKAVSTTKKAVSTTTKTVSKTKKPVSTTKKAVSTAKATSKPTSKPVSLSTFDSQILAAHNSARGKHGAKALTWNAQLAAGAQKWADKCKFEHSGGSLGPWGENLYASAGSAITGASAVNSWMSEAKDYKPSAPVYSHFTQVVWKATTQLGCAVSKCSGIFDPKYGKADFVVCEYSPPGNSGGPDQYRKNVQP